MIREAQRSELPAILELWLESTTWGHPFRVEFYSNGLSASLPDQINSHNQLN